MEYKYVRHKDKPILTCAIKAPNTRILLDLLPYGKEPNIKCEVKLGIATCSPKDQFSKSMGRLISSDRCRREEGKNLSLIGFRLIKKVNHAILFTEFEYDGLLIVFRSYLANDYYKTDCHYIDYME